MGVDLFQRVVITGNDAVTNLANGHVLDSGQDYLVHQLESFLEKKVAQSGVIVAQILTNPTTTANATDIYFLTENQERMNIQLFLTDAAAADAVRSADLWFMHSNHGFRADGISHLL